MTLPSLELMLWRREWRQLHVLFLIGVLLTLAVWVAGVSCVAVLHLLPRYPSSVGIRLLEDGCIGLLAGYLTYQCFCTFRVFREARWRLKEQRRAILQLQERVTVPAPHPH